MDKRTVVVWVVVLLVVALLCGFARSGIVRAAVNDRSVVIAQVTAASSEAQQTLKTLEDGRLRHNPTYLESVTAEELFQLGAQAEEMIFCTRLDCDNWDNSSTEPVESIKPL